MLNARPNHNWSPDKYWMERQRLFGLMKPGCLRSLIWVGDDKNYQSLFCGKTPNSVGSIRSSFSGSMLDDVAFSAGFLKIRPRRFIENGPPPLGKGGLKPPFKPPL